MKIAVVTPVHQIPRPWLEACIASIARQSIPCTHFVVSDGDETINSGSFSGVQFLHLAQPHRDSGNAARAVGSVSAIAQGFEAVAYLDGDNWYAADHLEKMLELHRLTGAAVCTAARNLVDLDGNLLGVCKEVDGEKFVDTNCLFLTSAAFDLVATWYRMPRALVAIGDRVIWKAIKDQDQELPCAHRAVPTVNYRTSYRAHYQAFGKTPPPLAKCIRVTAAHTGEFISAVITTADEDLSTNLRAIQGDDKAKRSISIPSAGTQNTPTDYNIVSLQSSDNIHTFCFDEVANLLKHSLTSLGFRCTFERNRFAPSAMNIVLGYHLLSATHLIAKYPCIIYQLEQLPNQKDRIDPLWIANLKAAREVWDYSQENVSFLQSRGMTNVRLLPIGFHEKMQTIPYASPKFDVLFYGSMYPRRVALLNLLAQHCKVKALFGIYGKDRDYYVARSRIILNIHAYEAQIMEQVRISYLGAAHN